MQDSTFPDARSLSTRPLSSSHGTGPSTNTDSFSSPRANSLAGDLFAHGSSSHEWDCPLAEQRPTRLATGLSQPSAASKTEADSANRFVPPPSIFAAPPVSLDGSPLPDDDSVTGLWPLPTSTGQHIGVLPRVMRLDGALDIHANDTSVAVVAQSHAQILFAGPSGLHIGKSVGQTGRTNWVRAAMAGDKLIQVTKHGFACHDLLSESEEATWRQKCALAPRSVAVGSDFVAVQSGATGKVTLHCVETGRPAFSLDHVGHVTVPRIPMAFLNKKLLLGMQSGRLELFERPRELSSAKIESVPRQATYETKLNGPVTALAVSPTGDVVAGAKTGALVIGKLQSDPSFCVAGVTIPQAHRGAVTAVATTSGLVATGGQDGHVSIWQAGTTSPLDTASFRGPIRGLTLNRDYLGVVAEGEPRVCFWPLFQPPLAGERPKRS